MTKTEAVFYYGGNQSDLARALNITPQYLSMWPDNLTPRQENEVLGLLTKEGKLEIWQKLTGITQGAG